MAALKNANEMPSGVDDLTDTTVQAGSASSGWNVYSGFALGPIYNFPLYPGVLLETLPLAEAGGGGDWPAGGQRIPHPSGVV